MIRVSFLFPKVVELYKEDHFFKYAQVLRLHNRYAVILKNKTTDLSFFDVLRQLPVAISVIFNEPAERRPAAGSVLLK